MTNYWVLVSNKYFDLAIYNWQNCLFIEISLLLKDWILVKKMKIRKEHNNRVDEKDKMEYDKYVVNQS